MIDLNNVYNEDCRKTLKSIPDNSIDAIVTDPPYELGFMGKSWDRSGISYNVKMWKQCLRILKPGGHLLAFGGTRTSHRMVCAIEDAGFEIRDSIQWLYGSGFPKSLNIGKAIDKLTGNDRKSAGKYLPPNGKEWNLKQSDNPNIQHKPGTFTASGTRTLKLTKGSSEWEGCGTALKPACELICLARKPLSEKTIAKNVLTWGTGAINIDGCRIPHSGENLKGGDNSMRSVAPASDGWDRPWRHSDEGLNKRKANADLSTEKSEILGRFPANIIHDGSQEVIKLFPKDTGAFAPVKSGQSGESRGIYGDYAQKGDDGKSYYDDKGSASRFFYCAKASASERHEGCYELPDDRDTDRENDSSVLANRLHNKNKNKNTHPTVKPIALIRYLCRLITPEGGLIYDPFGGSGTTAIAATLEGFKWILSELVTKHCEIANRRIFEYTGLFK